MAVGNQQLAAGKKTPCTAIELFCQPLVANSQPLKYNLIYCRLFCNFPY
jgi:hypothetical protein